MGIRDNLGFRSVIPIRQFAPHGIQAEFCQDTFRRVISYRLFVRSDPLAREKIRNITILVPRGSNPVGISCNLRLQFLKCIYILGNETALTRLRIVLRENVFVHNENRNDLITLRHGRPNFIVDPRTSEGSLGNLLVWAFAICVALGSALLTQAQQQPVVAAKR